MAGNKFLHVYVEKLTDWTTKGGQEDRYPQTCKAILDLRDALDLELTPRSRYHLACRRRMALASHMRPGAPATGGIGRMRSLGQPMSNTLRSRRWRQTKKVQNLIANGRQ